MCKNTLYIVGDSTLSKFNDTTYYYPRYGYGTQLYNYLKDINIVNLALSGRSSKSFLTEDNYKILTNSIKSGDYLLIGFGHNNEKSDDFMRFTSANKSIDDESSFHYSLYNYYIKLAKDRGATPILCTPIVRLDLNNDFSGNAGHITPNGDYRKSIIDLANMFNIDYVDLTTLTKNLFLEIGVNEACLHHAITAADMINGEIKPRLSSVDKAHLNIYGAKYAAYFVANELKKTSNSINKYLIDNIEEPKKDIDLYPNPDFKIIEYKAPDFDSYKEYDNFSTLDSEWYATAIGDLCVNPLDANSGFIAKEVEKGIYHVGQYGEELNGRFHASTDGFAYIFRQIPITKNFRLKANAKIIKSVPTKQTAFGLMLRDDAYLNQVEKYAPVMNNYISAGFLTFTSSTCIIYSRECTTELKMEDNIFEGYPMENDTFELSIERLGQAVTARVIYKDKLYEKIFIDFDLVAIDNDYMYVGMYSTKGNILEFNNVEFEITGEAKAA